MEKTPMQEAMKEIAELWSSPSDQPTYSQIFKILESKKEKEKQVIEDAVKYGFNDALKSTSDISFSTYYNQKFKQ